jgi:UPF0271 protein
MTIDINCDLGELSDNGCAESDIAIMPNITTVNIACGMHAGSPVTMEKTVLLAKEHCVQVGAHPGYPDRENFGRLKMMMSPGELRATILFQVGALKSIAEASGIKLQHVKCHGALYNAAAADFQMAMIIAEAVKDIDSSLTLIGMSGSQVIRSAEKAGLKYASEVFADRAYNDDGSLVPRNIPGAVLHDKDAVIERAIRMLTERKIVTLTGKSIPIEVDTICIHGDNPEAPVFARALSDAFRKAGIIVRSMSKKFSDV